MGVDHRSPDIGMTKKHLDRPYIIAGLQELGGERVAKGVGGDTLGELRAEAAVHTCCYI